MKNSKILWFLAMVILSIVACTKEEIEGPESIDPIIDIEITQTSTNPLVAQVSSDSEEGFDLGCFKIQVPFDLTVDGLMVTIEDVEDFEAALINTTDTTSIDFVYPISIVYEDGETAEVADGMALGEAFSVCYPDDGWTVIDGGFPAFLINDENSCYELAYPLTLTDLEENELVINSETEFIDALANNMTLFFNFPLTLIDEDGAEVVAQNDEEVFGLFFECEGNHPPCDTLPIGAGNIGCFDILFPLNVLVADADGATISIEVVSEDDFSAALLEGNIVGFDFPISLIDEEGIVIVVNNEAEFDAAFAQCFGFGEELNFLTLEFLARDSAVDGDCYTIQFPVTFTSEDGLVVIETTDAPNALDAIIIDQLNVIPVYPVSVVLVEDGNTVILENEEDLINLLADCN